MSNETSTHTEQPSTENTVQPQHPLLGFFGIGIAFNVILIAAYLVWAYRQWKIKNRHEP